MNVGFLGLGRMGRGMAARLREGGHDLIVFDAAPGAADPLVSAGAIRATSILEACRERHVVITMLVEDAAVLDVVERAGGIRDSLPRGSIHLAMGTHGVDAVARLADAHGAAGQILIAAPVLGRPDLAAEGRLGIIAAGDSAAIERCTPLLHLMGRRIFPAGNRPAAATAIKLANNHLLGCALVAMAEGFSFVAKHGIAAQTFHGLFTQSGFGAPAYAGYGQTMAEGTYDRVGSPVTVGMKDAILIRAAAARVAVPMPSLNVYRDRLLGAIAHGDGDRDQAVLAREQARAAGLDAQTVPAAGQAALIDDADRVVEKLQPVFDALRIPMFPAGRAPGHAATLALAHLAMVACAIQATAEAFVLVRKYGVDPRLMHAVMADGLFAAPVYAVYGSAMVEGTHTAGFQVNRAVQLLDLVMRAADRARLPLPGLDACRDRLLAAIAHGDGERDWSVLVREQARASGLPE